ncbi:DsbA family protein [Fulvivirga sediminis]|uniref:DsbA family protein n=1 Tax=Fulvivirga sediminis TaxID=2803949 RepID=A0A937K2H3_9BACT|nr:DsbA family protein [Fulvivirga sediminis]MBL3658375.1 DsbA family protein [Fulvivirga sediminis]
MKKIIYIMDPYCGWCYGNGDGITEVQKQYEGQIDFELMVGGMWLGSNAPTGGPQLENFIKTHSPRMESTTGAYVSEQFYKLTADPSYTFSSLEPAAAIVWVKSNYPEKTFAFAKAVQKVMFAEGQRLDAVETYHPIVKEQGMDVDKFNEEWLSESNVETTSSEFQKAAPLASGFPTLLFQNEEGLHRLFSGYLSKEKTVEVVDQVLKV